MRRKWLGWQQQSAGWRKFFKNPVGREGAWCGQWSPDRLFVERRCQSSTESAGYLTRTDRWPGVIRTGMLSMTARTRIQLQTIGIARRNQPDLRPHRPFHLEAELIGSERRLPRAFDPDPVEVGFGSLALALAWILVHLATREQYSLRRPFQARFLPTSRFFPPSATGATPTVPSGRRSRRVPSGPCPRMPELRSPAARRSR